MNALSVKIEAAVRPPAVEPREGGVNALSVVRPARRRGALLQEAELAHRRRVVHERDRDLERAREADRNRRLVCEHDVEVAIAQAPGVARGPDDVANVCGITVPPQHAQHLEPVDLLLHARPPGCRGTRAVTSCPRSARPRAVAVATRAEPPR